MDSCSTCRHWEQAGDEVGQGDMMLCRRISTGQGSEAMAIGQDGENADFLCAGTFGCTLWEAGDDEYGMDEGGDGGIEEIGGGAAQSVRGESGGWEKFGREAALSV